MARKEKSEDSCLDTLTKYEKTRIVGSRALQLSLGAFPMVEVRPGDHPIDVAKRELEQGKLPIIVRRKLADGSYLDISLLDCTKTKG